MGHKQTIQSNKIYFGKKQETAIKDYLINNELTKSEKEKIYVTIIHPAFVKLTENILFTYGNHFQFFKIGYDIDDLISMGTSYCYGKIEKFNPLQGHKAYSFFGTIVKRYFIQLSIQAQKNKKILVDLDNSDEYINEWHHENLIHEEKYHEYLFDKNFIFEIKNWFIENHELIEIVDDDEIKIMKSILDLIDFSEIIENTKKKALYIYIREMSRVEKTYKITNVIRKMKRPYELLKENYIASDGQLITGSLKINPSEWKEEKKHEV